MDWTLEDNMANSLYFCTILIGRKGGYTPFVQAEWKRLTPTRRWPSWTQLLLEVEID